VKKGLKSVYIYQSYYKNKLGGSVFWNTLYVVIIHQRHRRTDGRTDDTW